MLNCGRDRKGSREMPGGGGQTLSVLYSPDSAGTGAVINSATDFFFVSYIILTVRVLLLMDDVGA